MKVKFRTHNTKNPSVKIMTGKNEMGIFVMERFNVHEDKLLSKIRSDILDRFEMITPYEHFEYNKECEEQKCEEQE